MEMLCLVARRVQTTAWPGVVVARLHYTTFRDLYGGRGRSVGRENQYSGETVFTSRTNEMITIARERHRELQQQQQQQRRSVSRVTTRFAAFVFIH